MKYIVISPVKNEGKFINLTIDSMNLQTIKPVLWVIVNDGSKDNTKEIVEKFCKTNDWVKLVNRQDQGSRKRGKGVVEAFYAGYETLNQEYDFIVKLDGDVSFKPDYFERLLSEFEINPHLGIAGGGLYEKPDGRNWVLMTSKDHVRGCTKIYRYTCFKEIGGIVSSMGWDGIDEWKALSLGWKIRSFLETEIYHYRYTGAATGYLKSWIEQGNGAYRMGYHPLYIFARGFRRMVERPYVIGGVAMVLSYLISWLRKDDMLAEPSVINFIRRTQMKKLIGLISGKPVHE